MATKKKKKPSKKTNKPSATALETRDVLRILRPASLAAHLEELVVAAQGNAAAAETPEEAATWTAIAGHLRLAASRIPHC